VYAVIEDSGRQFRVSEGDVLDVDLRDLGDKAKTIRFDRVLLVSGDDGVTVGAPLVKGAKVTAEIVERVRKGQKVYVVRHRPRKSSRRKTGHRQRYTRVRITKIATQKRA